MAGSSRPHDDDRIKPGSNDRRGTMSTTRQAAWEGPSEEVAITRDQLGRIVREAWVEWAREQPGAKPSWLTGWDDLDEGQREVDVRIGEAVAKAARADERARIRSLLPYNVNCCDGFPAAVADLTGEHGE
jgi:hypothetical protein